MNEEIHCELCGDEDCEPNWMVTDGASEHGCLCEACLEKIANEEEEVNMRS